MSEVQLNEKYLQLLADIRQEEVMSLRSRFPTKVPVVVNKLPKEKYLPDLEKVKFLVTKDIAFGQFIMILRGKMRLDRTKSIYLIVNGKSIICPTLTMGELYKQYQNEDGYLYIQYASQESFGSRQ